MRDCSMRAENILNATKCREDNYMDRLCSSRNHSIWIGCICLQKVGFSSSRLLRFNALVVVTTDLVMLKPDEKDGFV